MPLTVRLSSKLQEALGKDATEDLVSWMQSVDDRQSDLRTLHELTTSRFEARLGEARAELRTEIGDLRMEMRLGFAEMRSSIAALESRVDQRIAAATDRLDQRILLVMKWTVGLWATTVVMLTAATFSWLNLR